LNFRKSIAHLSALCVSKIGATCEQSFNGNSCRENKIAGDKQNDRKRAKVVTSIMVFMLIASPLTMPYQWSIPKLVERLLCVDANYRLLGRH
jgi:hypothetical protein